MSTTFELLNRILEDADLSPHSYSGRGMHGRQCIGVTCNNELSLMTRVMHGLLDELEGADEPVDCIRDALDSFGTPSADAVGRSIVAYWPSVAWVYSDNEV